MDKHLGRLAAAVLCSLALAACGSDSESGGSEEDKVREVAELIASSDPAGCDKLTEDFLKQIGTKEECEKSAKEEDENPPTVEEVTVDGDTAEAIVVDEDRSTLKLVKEGDEWLADGIEVEEGAGASGSGEEETTTEEETADTSEDPSAGGDEIDAQAAVDAFLIGVNDGDPQVLCGLFSESYAKQLTGAKEFGIAECVNKLEGQSFKKLQNVLKGVKVEDTTVKNGGKAASVKLSNGNSVELKYQDGRFVIDQL